MIQLRPVLVARGPRPPGQRLGELHDDDKCESHAAQIPKAIKHIVGTTTTIAAASIATTSTTVTSATFTVATAMVASFAPQRLRQMRAKILEID